MRLRRSPQTALVLAELSRLRVSGRYGYDLSRLTGLKSGTLYPILMRLAEHRLLETSWETPEPGRPPRHLYKLTSDGARYDARQVAVPARQHGEHGGIQRGAGNDTPSQACHADLRRRRPLLLGRRKDWAAATAQELAFIESELGRVALVLGSARLLLHQRCEVPLASVAGVPAASDGLFRQTAGRARGACYLASVMALCLAHSLAHLHDPVRRTGCYILIAAILYTVYQVIARRGRRMPPNADLTAQTAPLQVSTSR